MGLCNCITLFKGIFIMHKISFVVALGLVLGTTVTVRSFGTDNPYVHYTTLNFRNGPEFHEIIDLKTPDLDKLEAVIFFLTNEIRLKNNLLPLEYNEKLEKTAAMHAFDMVNRKFFSHFNTLESKKKTPNDRARLNQITNPTLAENIAEGFVLDYTSGKSVILEGKGQFRYREGDNLISPRTYLALGEALLRDWMNSREHKKNILAKEAVELGCGVAYYTDAEFNEMPSCIAVQNFQWYQPVR